MRGINTDGSRQYKHHLENYDHQSEFGAKDICRLWRAEKWDPDRLLRLYKRAGAKNFRSGDEPFTAEMPLDLAIGQPTKARVFADRSAFVIYLNDRVALTWRGYDHTRGGVGLFVTGGTASFTDVRVRTPFDDRTS